MRLLILLGFAFWMVACTPSGKQTSSKEALSSDSIQYAQGFTVQRFDTYIMVEVRDPWDSTRLLQRYLLVDRTKSVPGGLPKGTIVKVPVKDIVIYTSVHAAIIDQLHETDKVIGVCEPRYMDTPAIQEGIQAGRIADLGEATSPNIEKMIELGAELVIASPFQNSSYGPVEKIGIPIIEGADYMEAFPLGRTEWIRFYGLLFGKEEMADSIFKETEQSYLSLKDLTANIDNRPTVLSEKKFGSSWYVPSGDSYMAHLIEDAGADYMFKDFGYENFFVGTVEAYPDLETVLKFVKAKKYKKAVLMPLLMVAGDHALNDMAGDEDDSWVNIFNSNGVEARAVVKGIGEYAQVAEMYIEHIQEYLNI